MNEHGGNIDEARKNFGGAPDRWVDLSTGINPVPYPHAPIPHESLLKLPTKDSQDLLEITASNYYGTDIRAIASSGAQSIIQILPFLTSPGRASILAPTFNEYRTCFSSVGWKVHETSSFSDLKHSDVAIVVNPNNPDGKQLEPCRLKELAHKVQLLIIDESFGDVIPKLSYAPLLSEETQNVVVIRSFGKFFGLAGLRLGFALSTAKIADKLRGLIGPWAVSGPAIEIGLEALRDLKWAELTRGRLVRDTKKLDKLATAVGWKITGGTLLFRLYETGDASRNQALLAKQNVWCRRFSYSPSWLRLGLPDPNKWGILSEAFKQIAKDH